MSARREDYDAAGYGQATYGESHKQGYLRVRNDALAELIAEAEGGGDRRLKILEVACGPGFSLAHLNRARANHFLVGIDQSPEMLRESWRNIEAASATPRLARASAVRLPFPDQVFDVVFATRFIHIFRDKSIVLDELRRVLRPGGVLAIEFYGRPYYLLPFLAGQMKRPWRQFLWQHPTVAHVREIMGGTTRFIALRLGGEQYLHRALGTHRVRSLLKHAWRRPLRLLVAEYFAIAQPTPRAETEQPR